LVEINIFLRGNSVDKHSGIDDGKNSESGDSILQKDGAQENDRMDEIKGDNSIKESSESSPRIYEGLDVVNRSKESKFGMLEDPFRSPAKKQKT
jgi:hypothetical protein